MIDVYAWSTDRNEAPRYLGQAIVNRSRPDVAQVFRRAVRALGVGE